jgi:hyaluronan synthase/N-acetylglucosaminyltransferase
MHRFLTIYLILYGILALGHIAVQVVLGHLDYRRQRRTPVPTSTEWTPSVSLLVTVYNENLLVLHRCLRSLAKQNYPRLEVIIIDDRSTSREGLLDVLGEFATGRFRVMLSARNQGKRQAQRSVLDEVRGDIIVTTDSDTIIAEGGVRALVAPFMNPSVGAATGDVGVTNKRQNLLTRLISYRYWSAFHQERAAQSYFKVVMCCSGPLAAYRRSVIEDVKDEYVSQMFLDRLCTFGDDRHLTNLILREGYEVVFVDKAKAHTEAPTTIPRYLHQQVRWNKSFYREMLWTLRFAHRRHPYMLADLLLQGVLPFMLMFALATALFQAVMVDSSHIGRYLITLVGIGIVRAAYGAFRTRDPGFFLFVVYGVLHVFLLIPTRLYALATIRRTHWGTRNPALEDPVSVPAHDLPGGQPAALGCTCRQGATARAS